MQQTNFTVYKIQEGKGSYSYIAAGSREDLFAFLGDPEQINSFAFFAGYTQGTLEQIAEVNLNQARLTKGYEHFSQNRSLGHDKTYMLGVSCNPDYENFSEE